MTGISKKLDESKEEEGQTDEAKEPMVSPTGTSYLSNDGEYFSETKMPPQRVLSTQSLLGLVGLEGHEESEEDVSTGGISAVTEEQEIMTTSPSTPAYPMEDQEIEDVTCNTTPPGSVQESRILSLSPPRLTTYSVGSVTSASVTESFVLQPRPGQGNFQRQNHLPQESPQLSRSSLVQHPQLQPQAQPRSRPPRAPNHSATIPGSSNSVGGGPVSVPRSVIGGGHESGTGALGSGHSRTPTDATNYSFLSLLTDVSGGEYNIPRRRTLSWDNNENSKRKGHATDSKSLGGASTPGSILQPILFPDEIEPPMSISTSNLRKALPTFTGPFTTSPTRQYSRNTNNASLSVPPSLPPRENLHPLIQKLQSISHGKKIEPMPHATLSTGENNLHPLIKRVQDSSADYKASTSTSSPFTANLQDEKKDDYSGHSQSVVHQKALPDRSTSDYGSFSSSFCSSAITIRPQKKSVASTGRKHEIATISSTETGEANFKLREFLDAVKECNVETDIIESIEMVNFLHESKRHCNNSSSSFFDWAYFLVAWGILNLGERGLTLSIGAEVWNMLFSVRFGQYYLSLGAAIFAKRKMWRRFLDAQIRCYQDEFLRMRNGWVILNEIAGLLIHGEKKDISSTTTNQIARFHCVSQGVIEWNGISSVGGLGITRENFMQSTQCIYEGLARRDKQAEVSFTRFCEATNRSGGVIDETKKKLLLELFRPSKQDTVSKFDFIRSTDSIFKRTTLLIENVNNVFKICNAVDELANTIFFTAALTLAMGVYGVDSTLLVLTFIGIVSIFSFMIYSISAENLKGIFRLLTQRSYDIGDRVYFIEPSDIETKFDNGPPSGGWIIENIDLYKTTLRQGITGERSTLSNGSILLLNSRVINWKCSHKANVKVSIKLSEKIGRDQIHFLLQQISEWIENRPCEWIRLLSFQMVDTQQQCKRCDVMLRHRESWHNYPAVQDSKKEILIFLEELQSNLQK